jgi:ferric-dicitrate binding protein FerR (iron transport regulator)
MTISEIVAIVAVVLSVGTNVALYVHLSSTVNTRFDSVERRLELVQGSLGWMCG